jgi:DNA repair protein RadC
MKLDSSTIRDLPPSERPRERLLLLGPASLSDAELVAVLLRTGRPGVSALELARDLLCGLEGLPGLLGIDSGGLRRCGLGEAKAATLMAACELAARLARAELPLRPALGRPVAAARYLLLRYGCPDQEVMGCLFLDARHRLIAEREVFRGTLNRAAVEPRPILKEGLLRSAAGLLLFHTHPSGDPTPSPEDLAFTRRLAEAAEIVGLSLVDHLVLGGVDRWISLRERGSL